MSNEIKKDWKHRVYGEDLNDTFQQALTYIQSY